MLEKVITPFLSLSEAAEALVADGYHCDEQALIALAAQGELRLCFAYAGRLAQYSSDDFYAEVSGGEYREYDLTRGTEPESSGGFKGYLALPQMRVEHACLRHEDWNTMPVGRVQIALVMPGFRPDITPKSGYVLVRINLQYDEATDKSWDELELGAMSAPIGILSSELRAFVAGKSAAVSPVDKPLAARAEATYQRIIGALLECIAGKVPGVRAHPSFESEAKLIKKIAQRFDGMDGLSERNLQTKFSDAKRILDAT